MEASTYTKSHEAHYKLGLRGMGL